MEDSKDTMPENNNTKMKRSEWIQLGILIVLLLVTFPFILFLYTPLLWVLFRFLVPLAILGFVAYFGIKFLQMGTESKGSSENFAKVWTSFSNFVRRNFLKATLTIVTVSMLAVAMILAYKHYSKGGLTEERLQKMSQSLEKYKSHHGAYPAGLADLIGNDPLKREWFQDSWGNSIVYIPSANGGYNLSSPGADGKLNTSDDVVVMK
jgi:hypothetical protein